MASLLEDLEQWLINADKAVADGDDIFRDFAPDVPDEIIVLYEYDSVLSGIKSANSAVRYVQVTYRATSATVAKNACDDIFHLFMNPDQNITSLPNNRWAIMIAKQVPFKIEMDNQMRYVYGFNVAITTNPD
jgi:hypothetical protein